MHQYGGLDIGGTKIEARLFDHQFETVTSKRFSVRNAKPQSITIEALTWLFGQSGDPKMPIGIGVPGIVDQENHRVKMANLGEAGDDFVRQIEGHFDRSFFWENDCRAFAFSEAHSGSGHAHKNVIGLIIGTGIAAGQVREGKLTHGLNNIAVEIGHIGMSSRMLEKFNLPNFRCGCGRIGCIETYISGTGLENIYEHKFGERLSAVEIATRKSKDDLSANITIDLWYILTCEALDIFTLLFDPDMIVLGGGLSLMPNVAQDLSDLLVKNTFDIMSAPTIKIAQHGDSSGARGVAILAAQQYGE